MLCKRGGVLTPTLRQALNTVVGDGSSCKSTGRPLISRKLSFGKILASFNSHVQIDIMLIVELSNMLILHLVDVHTRFSVTVLLDSREMELVTQEFEAQSCNIHGAPELVSGDQEIKKRKFKELTSCTGIRLEARPARCDICGFTHGRIL